MSEKYFVGADLIASSNNGKYKPVSRVTLKLDDSNSITAGDDTGFEVIASCPHATQEMANALLEKFRGYTYQAFEADEANLNPSAELGDGVTASGQYGVISKLSDDGSGFVGISSPGKAELEDEFPMDGPLTRMISRELSGLRSSITKTEEKIRLEIIGEIVDDNGNPISVASAITQTADSISAAVTSVTETFDGKLENYSTITQTADSISTAVSAAKTEIETGISTTLENYSTITQTAESIASTVSATIGDLGTDENENPYTVASKIEQTAKSIKTSVEGALGTDEKGNLISVSSSIETALEGINLEASSSDGETTLTLTPKEGVTITSKFSNLTKGDLGSAGTTKIYGGLIDTDSIKAEALHLNGILTIYSTVLGDLVYDPELNDFVQPEIEVVGGYIGYDDGFNSSSGIGIRHPGNLGNSAQMVCTESAVRISYGDPKQGISQVVCNEGSAFIEGYSLVTFAVGGSARMQVDYNCIYPAQDDMTCGTAYSPWYDVYAAGTSMSDLLARVIALESA